MTANNLKNMIENHELDNLMTNGKELEKLKSSRTTEQVLEILKKHNYTETKEVFEKELLEILQSIKLNEENMNNISGGRLMQTKNLSMMLGSLMALNSAGFMSAGAVTEKQKHNEKYSVGSLLNNVDTKTVKHIGLGAAGIGLLWAIKEIVTLKRDNTTFKLSSIQQKIYDNTQTLSEKILKYVEKYISTYNEMPATELTNDDPEHQEILELIGEIRNDWLNMYDNNKGPKLETERRKKLIENKEEPFSGGSVLSVRINQDAVENLFRGLPVGGTQMGIICTPNSPKDCEGEMDFLKLRWEIQAQFRWDFQDLTGKVIINAMSLF